MSKKFVSVPEQAATREPVQKAAKLVEAQAQVAPQSNQQKEDKMSSKKKAAKLSQATAAPNAGNNPATKCFNDTTDPQVCQAKSGENVGISSWENVKAQLEATLRVSVEQAHASCSRRERKKGDEMNMITKKEFTIMAEEELLVMAEIMPDGPPHGMIFDFRFPERKYACLCTDCCAGMRADGARRELRRRERGDVLCPKGQHYIKSEAYPYCLYCHM